MLMYRVEIRFLFKLSHPWRVASVLWASIDALNKRIDRLGTESGCHKFIQAVVLNAGRVHFKFISATSGK